MDGATLLAGWETLKSGTLWHNPNLGDPRHPCKGYADANPAESDALDQWVMAIASGSSPSVPTLATATGRGLRDSFLALLASPTTPPPPPPPPTPTPTKDPMWWWGPAPPDTSARPTPTLPDVTRLADLLTLCAAGGRGGVARVRGFAADAGLNIGNRNGLALLCDPASFKVVGKAGSSDPALGIHGFGVEVYDIDVSNPLGGSGKSGGDGVKAYNGSADAGPCSFKMWGARIHDVASQGFSCQASTSIHADVQADVTKWGLNPNLDPHAEPGTGQHGVYIGGGSGPTSGRFILTVHDGDAGAGCQAGAYFQSAELWLSAKNLGWKKDYMAGNAFQPWGGRDINVVVKNLLVDGAQRALFDESLTGGSIVIEGGRFRNVRLSPPVQTSGFIAGEETLLPA